MAYPTSLSKVTSQNSTYGYIWQTRGTATVVGKYIGTSMIWFHGVDDTDALAKINGHEGERSAINKNPHD